MAAHSEETQHTTCTNTPPYRLTITVIGLLGGVFIYVSIKSKWLEPLVLLRLEQVRLRKYKSQDNNAAQC